MIPTGRPKPGLTAIHRFWLRIVKSEQGCWGWIGESTDNGYGRFRVDGRKVLAHRFAYALLIGPIPNDLFVLHKCDNPPCCNPDHLFLGTKSDNSRDCMEKGRYVNAQSLKTHCAHGHEFSDANTIIRATGARRCKSCSTEQSKARYHRRKSQ